MLKYLAKRLGRSFITLIIILTILFVLMRQMPIEIFCHTAWSRMQQNSLTGRTKHFLCAFAGIAIAMRLPRMCRAEQRASPIQKPSVPT